MNPDFAKTTTVDIGGNLPPGRTLGILEALEEADGVGIETWSR